MEEKIKVTWSFSALEMLAEIHEYISERSEHSADNYIDGIYESTKKIERHPESCAPCKNPNLEKEVIDAACIKITSSFMNI